MGHQPWLRLAIATAVLGATAGVLFAFGVGGYRQGGFICTGAIVLAGCGTFLLPVGPGRLRGDANRGLWLVVLAVVGVVLGGVLADRAPWSTGRLVAEMDELDLPFFEVVDERATGSSSCRPTCPEVLRTYHAPNTSVRAAMLTVAASLNRVGLIQDESILSRIGDEPIAQLRTDRVQVRIEIHDVDDQARVVKIRYRAL